MIVAMERKRSDTLQPWPPRIIRIRFTSLIAFDSYRIGLDLSRDSLDGKSAAPCFVDWTECANSQKPAKPAMEKFPGTLFAT